MAAAGLDRAARARAMGWVVNWLTAADLSRQRATAPIAFSINHQADALLFALTIANVERGAIAIIGEDHEAVRRYQAAIPHAKDIRDMITHYDQYIVGSGRLQKRGEVSGFNVYFSNDGASLTVNIAERSMRVADAYDAAMALIRDLDRALDAEVPAGYQEPGND